MADRPLPQSFRNAMSWALNHVEQIHIIQRCYYFYFGNIKLSLLRPLILLEMLKIFKKRVPTSNTYISLYVFIMQNKKKKSQFFTK